MSDTNFHYFNVSFFDIVNNFRKGMMDLLVVDVNTSNIDDLHAYAYEMNNFSNDLLKLVEIHSDVRFNNLREMCREGFTAVLMPEITHQIELLGDDAQVFVLVFEDKELIGTLTNKDLNF